jgi:hypothetical protein
MEFSGVGEKEILKKERRREGGSARVIKLGGPPSQGGPPVKEVLLSRRISCKWFLILWTWLSDLIQIQVERYRKVRGREVRR